MIFAISQRDKKNYISENFVFVHSRLNDFILRSGSPTAYQNSGSPTAYQNTTTSYQNVQLSPKILRIFDNNYKSSDHQNSHQHGKKLNLISNNCFQY